MDAVLNPCACHAKGILNLKKRSETLVFLTILTSKPLSRHIVVQIWSHLRQPILHTRPFLGADFPSKRSHRIMGKHSISRNSYPPKALHLTHLSCVTSARSHLLVDRSSAATPSIVGSQIPKRPLTISSKLVEPKWL